MGITIHAIADDRSHGESLLSQLSRAGFNRSAVSLVPAGIHRLVRSRTLLYRAFGSRLVAAMVVTQGAAGAIVGAGVGLHLIMLPSAHTLTSLQRILIVAGAVPVGGAIGLLSGLIIGIVTAGIVLWLRRREKAHEPVMLSVEADTLTSARTAEAIFTDHGAHEIRIARLDH